MSFESSGAEYLRRLRSQESPGVVHEVPAEPATPNLVPAQDARAAAGERRRSPRYKCEGSAEFRVAGSDVRTWGTFTDISMAGCYVEMMATFPVGSRVDLVLELQGVRVQAQGEVRVSYPCLGMGIAFTELADPYRKRLRDLIDTLAPPSLSRASEASPAAPASPALPLVVNAAAALQALVEFFEKRALLTKEEFMQVLRSSQGV
jgi:hypothetical protein